MSAERVPYTPGPWSICKDHPDWICPPGAGYPIAMVPPALGAVAAANARLIATAPELVEVLGDMLDQFDGHLDVAAVRRARAIVEKAMGSA